MRLCARAFVHALRRVLQGHLLGCLGSMATRTMGVASKLSGMKGGQAGEVEMVADFSTKSSRPPIPAKERGPARSRRAITC